MEMRLNCLQKNILSKKTEIHPGYSPHGLLKIGFMSVEQSNCVVSQRTIWERYDV